MSGAAYIRDDGAVYVDRGAVEIVPIPPPRPVAPTWPDGDFAAALQALLPRGPVWPRDVDAVQSQVALALAPSYTRNTASAAALLQDSPIGVLDQMLPDWEATTGLPDSCAGDNPSVDLRRAQVMARIKARGGQSVAYYTDIAATLGYQVAIEEFAPSYFGDGYGGSYGADAWAHTWQVTVPAGTLTATTAVLECEMRRIAPAHTVLLFEYATPAAPASWDSPAGWDKGGLYD